MSHAHLSLLVLSTVRLIRLVAGWSCDKFVFSRRILVDCHKSNHIYTWWKCVYICVIKCGESVAMPDFYLFTTLTPQKVRTPRTLWVTENKMCLPTQISEHILICPGLRHLRETGRTYLSQTRFWLFLHSRTHHCPCVSTHRSVFSLWRMPLCVLTLMNQSGQRSFPSSDLSEESEELRSNHYFTCVFVTLWSLSRKKTKSVRRTSEQVKWHFNHAPLLLRIRLVWCDQINSINITQSHKALQEGKQHWHMRKTWTSQPPVQEDTVLYVLACLSVLPWSLFSGNIWGISTLYTRMTDFRSCNVVWCQM